MILVLLLNIVAAAAYTIGKAALTYIEPILLISVRMVIGGLILLGYLWYFKRDLMVIRRRDIGLFATVALFLIYLAYVPQFWALQYVSAFKVSFFFNFAPFITALLSYLYFHEALSKRQWFGMTIGFIGMIPMFIIPEQTEGMVGTLGAFSLPDIALIGAVTASVIGWIAMKDCVDRAGYSILWVNGIGMVGGGLLALPTSLILEGHPRILHPTHETLGSFVGSDFAAFAVYTALLIIIGNIIMHNLYSVLLRQYSPTFLAFSGFTCPLFTAFFGWLFLQETPSVWFFLSVFLVGCGLYLFYQQKLNEQSLNA